MADNTKIEWADATVNAVNGCSVVSPGCTNCYAMRLAGTRMKHHPTRAGLTIDTKAGPVWTGEVRLNEPALLQPLSWKRPRRIFWNAHGDLFHDKVPDEWIDRVFAVCALTPQHKHMILTKRSARMRDHICSRAGDYMVRLPQALDDMGIARSSQHPLLHWPLNNVWLGVSVEDQQRADERIPDLLATPAAVRFLSCEPLLGPVDLTLIPALGFSGAALPKVNLLELTIADADAIIDGAAEAVPCLNSLRLYPELSRYGFGVSKLDWIIVGGESGPGARPVHPDWVRSLRDQCKAAGTAFFFKQWGEWVNEDQSPADAVFPGEGFDPFGDGSYWAKLGKKRAGRLLDGVEHSEFPA